MVSPAAVFYFSMFFLLRVGVFLGGKNEKEIFLCPMDVGQRPTWKHFQPKRTALV